MLRSIQKSISIFLYIGHTTRIFYKDKKQEAILTIFYSPTEKNTIWTFQEQQKKEKEMATGMHHNI